MKSNVRLSLAIGAVLSLCAGTAVAVTTPTSGNTLNVGGATATDRSLANTLLAEGGLCVEGTVAANTIADVYVVGTTFAANAPGSFRVDCQAASGTLAGTAISIGKFAGGSDTGLLPVANGVDNIGGTLFVRIPGRTGCDNAASPTVVDDGAGGLIRYRLFIGCDNLNTVPQAGVSDVEPALFGDLAVASRLNTAGAAVVPMGVVVSRNFYRSLQIAQGLSTCADTTTGGADDTEACHPSLSKAQASSLLSRSITNASQIRINGAPITAPSATFQLDVEGELVSTTDFIHICKRADSSGTEQAAELLWFGEGCLPAANLGATLANAAESNATGKTWSSTAAGAFGGPAGYGNFDTLGVVFAGSGSGDVESCLDWADDNGLFAVGINSGDRSPNDSNLEFRYVRIDGYLPSIINVLNQDYPHYVENVVVSPNGAALNGNSAAFNTGNRPTIFNEILLPAFSNPAILEAAQGTRTWGQAGLLARPVDGIRVPDANPVVTNPINTTIRAIASAAGTPVNNCQPPVAVAPLMSLEVQP